MATLFIVATPLGNLEDLTLRALRALKEVAFILCEDTRTTKKLLDRYAIKTPLMSYHQHSNAQKLRYIFQLLKDGENLALVCDAGTPGISDPGSELISFLLQESEKEKSSNRSKPQSISIVPVPGPSAITAAASIAEFPMNKFLFLGFPPQRKKRRRFFEEIRESKHPVIFYESPHRIIRTLQELKALDETLPLAVCRELTKKFETIYRGSAKEIALLFEREKPKGEFVVVVGK